MVSYDISLKDPVTRKVANVPGHLMIGGTYKADYHPETGTFTPAMNTEAWLNITYKISCRKENIEYEVDEGDTENYWTPTAANAIRPLYKLIALARMRPDCIWDGG